MEEQEKSASGAPIHRYSEPTHKGFQPADGISHMEEISDHIQKHVGPIETVYHEMLSHLVHIDVHYVKPNDKFPFHTLVTSGMSDKPMTVPEGFEDCTYAELCMLLPASWPIHYENYQAMEEAFIDENTYWPVRWLKSMARFPHEFETWLAWGHTIPNGPEAAPFADNTSLGGILLWPSISLPGDFFNLKTADGTTINFYCLYPIYKEELDYKLEHGVDKLIDEFEKYNILDVVDINRINTCKS